MAEHHYKTNGYSSFRWQHWMQQLWNFVKNEQSGVLQFVTGNSAKSGGSAANPSSADLSAGFGSNNDYIVIEPVLAYPGGGKWQARFLMEDFDDTNPTDMTCEVSWLGGWDTGAEDFGSNQIITLGSYGAQFESLSLSQKYLFSCSNSDQYTNSAGTQSYTYFRHICFNAQGTEHERMSGVYVGGYIPSEPDSDTKPVCVFTGRLGHENHSYYWGQVNGTKCYVPGDYAHTTAGGNQTVFIEPGQTHGTLRYCMNRSGGWVMIPMWIMNYNDKIVMGTWGRYTMLGSHYDTPDGSRDSELEYMVGRDIVFRWKED